MQLGTLMFHAGSGAPHATDLVRGRRPGSLEDFRELIQLSESLGLFHAAPPIVEPQDVTPNLRHLKMTEAMLLHSSKVPSIYARGTPQVHDCFDLIQDFRGLSQEVFQANPWCYTVINSNSPRQLDIPMAQGLIDFAAAGQLSIITPFTLMGAMAPITVEGALTLSHAEALAAITLTQLVRSGAPVMYGTFTSNVHMKSGAPAFGTPEHFLGSAGAGQLARHLGLPWRSASGSAANLGDAQGANETQFATWGSLLGGATAILHAAGWLEGGLAISYEKLITDAEILAMIATLCAPKEETVDQLALDAIAEVAPGSHFFETQHTLDRYATAFYNPLVHRYDNIGTWTEKGGIDATTRATKIWQDLLATPIDLGHSSASLGRLEVLIHKRIQAGGAMPIS